MRVLLVNSLYPPADVGGAERSVEQLARSLVAAGVSTAVATLVPSGGEGVETRDGVRIHRLPLRHLYWPYDGRRRPAARRALWHGLEAVSSLMDGPLGRVVKAERPDLIHAHVTTGFGGAVVRTVRRAGLPLVQTLRDYSTLCCRAALFRHGRSCAGSCLDCVLLTQGRRGATERVDHVVGISRAVLERHQEAGCFRETPTTVIGNAAGGGGLAADGIGSRTGPLTFGFIGRVEPEKGIEVLLRATARLTGDWRLRIAGRGEAAYVERLRRTFVDDRIAWLGQTEASGFYQDVDVVVAPAVWAEPFGRNVVEAAMQGRGVIASRIGGLPEATAGAGRVALVPPGDVEALAAVLARVLDQPASWRNLVAPSKPVWTEASIAKAHVVLYRAVLANRASRISADLSQA